MQADSVAKSAVLPMFQIDARQFALGLKYGPTAMLQHDRVVAPSQFGKFPSRLGGTRSQELADAKTTSIGVIGEELSPMLSQGGENGFTRLRDSRELLERGRRQP